MSKKIRKNLKSNLTKIVKIIKKNNNKVQEKNTNNLINPLVK